MHFTPFSRAVRIPLLACACEETYDPIFSASSTAARISSLLKWQVSPALSPCENTPLVVIIFTKSAPLRAFIRQALRTSSTPVTIYAGPYTFSLASNVNFW